MLDVITAQIEPNHILVAVGIAVGLIAGLVPHFVQKILNKIDSISEIKAAGDMRHTILTKDIGVMQEHLKTCWLKYDKLEERVLELELKIESIKDRVGGIDD